ncbi:hypothetical protein V6N11_018133 [Hibiscus sabdariffa]|uniref:Uncharacterized protein n=1 Tax=Hibiscus sabdariffa TaxID=183260 RepID=A0ABR2T6Z8_9ROSI
MDGKIEGLEKTMEDVQGDIVQMKDFLGQLQTWMEKKDEIDTEILRQVKGKSTILSYPPIGNEVMAENSDEQGFASRLEAIQRREEIRPQKLELPIFSGDNPYGWLNRAERYFHFNGIANEDKLEDATVCLDSKAFNCPTTLYENKRGDDATMGIESSSRRGGHYKRLSDVEYHEKLRKGLCFCCDEKYSPNHQCN